MTQGRWSNGRTSTLPALRLRTRGNLSFDDAFGRTGGEVVNFSLDGGVTRVVDIERTGGRGYSSALQYRTSLFRLAK